MSQPKINPKLDNLPGPQTSRWAVSIQQQSTDLGKTVAAAAVPVVVAAAETSKCAANNVRAIDITLKPSKFDWADEESKFDDSSWETGLTKSPPSTEDNWIKLTGKDNARSELTKPRLTIDTVGSSSNYLRLL